MKAELVQFVGGDLTVVNAARVSMGKHKDMMDDKDKKLIQYLAKHGHFTPYTHCSATFRIECPIFVARQLHKHQIGFSVNEISLRYVEVTDSFFVPDKFRQSAPNIKQGSSSEEVNSPTVCHALYTEALSHAYDTYKLLLQHGVCREQARAVLPLATNTEFYMTGTLMAWARMYKLRTDSHAQVEIQLLAKEIGDTLQHLWPYSWGALTKGEDPAVEK